MASAVGAIRRQRTVRLQSPALPADTIRGFTLHGPREPRSQRATARQVRSTAMDRDPFVLQQPLFVRQPARESSEAPVAADDAVAGDAGGVGVLVERVADGAVALGPERRGD